MTTSGSWHCLCHSDPVQCRHGLRKCLSGAGAAPVSVTRLPSHISSAIAVIPNRPPRSSMMRLTICMFAQLSQCRETHGWLVPSGSELSVANCGSNVRFFLSVQVCRPHPRAVPWHAPSSGCRSDSVHLCYRERHAITPPDPCSPRGQLPGLTLALSGPVRHRYHPRPSVPVGLPSRHFRIQRLRDQEVPCCEFVLASGGEGRCIHRRDDCPATAGFA